MYEAMTPEVIRQSILERIPSTMDKREGTQLSDEAAAVALAISSVYHQMDTLVPAFYLDESSGPYIDRQAAVVGIQRKPGTRAGCALTVTGKPGAQIPAGTRFFTAAQLGFVLDDPIIVPNSGTAAGHLTAEAEGGRYNIGPGEIVSTSRNYSGIRSYTNGRADGGTDRERDAALLERYQARMRRPATSGNAYHYEQWAMEVPGVGACRVFGLYDGPGTVRLVVADSQMTPPATEIVDAVRDHVAAEMPIGPRLTVDGAAGLEIRVSARLRLGQGAELGQVRETFRAALEQWLSQEARQGFHGHLNCDQIKPESQSYTLPYTRIGYLLLSCPGVLDFGELIVNQGTGNINVAADQVPVVGEVVLT